MEKKASYKQIVVVLGMHRSGTSLTTRALKVLGVDLGDRLIPPIDGDNDKGFWEDIDINDFDNALLEKVGSSWDRLTLLDENAQTHRLAAQRETAVSMLKNKMKSAELFGFKDPRTAILLPFWQTVFQELDLDDSYVIAVRNPLSVANSLLKRNDMPLEAGILLWAKHMSGILRGTQGKRRVVVDYDLMLESPSHQIKRIASALSLPFDESSQQRLDLFENEFINQNLRHHQASLTKLKRSELVPDFVKHAYDWMLKLAKDEVEFSDAGLEEFWQGFEEVCGAFNAGYRYIDRLAMSLQQYEDENKELSDKLLEEEHSYSEMEAVRDRISGELENAHQQLAQANNELGELEKRQHELQLLYKNAITERDGLALSLQQHKDENKELSNKLLEETHSYREVEAVRDRISGELEKAHEKLAQVTNELDEVEKRQHEIHIQSQKQNQQMVDELEETRSLLSEYKAMYQNAIAERDNRQKSYEELHKDFKQAVTERDEVQAARTQYVRENVALREQVTEILNSRSWRLTRVLRAIRYYLITLPARVLRRYISKTLRTIWVILPASPEAKSRLKKQLFSNMPFFFRRSMAYDNWLALEASSMNMEAHNSILSEKEQQDLSSDEKDLYVPLSNDGVLAKLPVRVVAFYLPQFHAIPENDKWWGEGFTEWTNVKPAKPQFKGHYQPHVPGELGYYDLTDPSVQKRQVELAKQFGVGGFCFYFYWFAGKRLLEAPILNYLNDSSLDLPFCLCWANENWSRCWDGLDNDVLIDQQHSRKDDFAFIEYVSRYLRDPRNMQINGKPLLLVYRPRLLPSPKETALRWRTWCRENGIGEIYLAYTQSFETEDPEKYGFDAAVEFPPNNSGPPVITDQVELLSSEFTGIVYDWRIFVKRSENYQQPDYTLFRSVTPSWDNTARRKSAGAIFANSTPADYQVWLTRSIEDTLAHRENQDERLVFINAWNEWAEGAYLEPDEKYGYAYLQATRNALEQVVKDKDKRHIVLVIHDAYPHGAQYLSLNMAKVLQESMGFVVDMIVLGDGPLIEEYRKYANVHELAGQDVQGKKTVELVQQLHRQGASSAITNTTVTGLIVPVLKQNGFTVVSLVHELPQLIKDYQLQEHVRVIANEADKIVFAATVVKNGFESFAKLDETKVVIRPQGLYKKNSLQTSEQIQTAHLELRKRFSLPEKAKIILGVGFADFRKGIDIFVESGIRVIKKNKNTYFLWLGNFESKIERDIKHTIEKSGFSKHFIFPGLDSDSDIYYAGADIYALTSREDPFPSVVLEALDASTPVVAFTDSGGSVELLSKGCGVLIDEMSSKAFSSALVELIDNSGRIHQLGQKGKKIIDKEFSFRKYLFDLSSMSHTGLQRVSVVVPNYNYEQYINERMQSIVDQNYPIYEIIILDDNSSDNSVSVIKEFIQDQLIDCEFIVNADNSGNVFKQWAKGVALSTGDYVWIAEADDLSDPDFLNEVMKGFDDPFTVMSYCESKQMDSTGNILCDNYLDYVSDISRKKWLSNYKENGINEITNSLAIKNTIPNVSAVVFKRNVIFNVLKEKVNEIKQYKNAGDWLAYVYLLQHGDIAYSSKSLNSHRRHESSVTISGFGVDQLEEILRVQKKIKELFEVEENVITKANNYSQLLYDQFGLATKDAIKLSDNNKLNKYFVET